MLIDHDTAIICDRVSNDPDCPKDATQYSCTLCTAMVWVLDYTANVFGEHMPTILCG